MRDYQTESSSNRYTLETRMLCGCYFCIRHISSVDVDEYTDDGATALCPNCGVDALIIDVSTEELEEAHERWFCGKAKEQSDA